MGLADNIRAAAQSDDWRGHVCHVMNKVLTAYLAQGYDRPTGSADDARTFMLIVACALDGGKGVEL